MSKLRDKMLARQREMKEAAAFGPISETHVTVPESTTTPAHSLAGPEPKPAPKWTKEPPQAPGWYWNRSARANSPLPYDIDNFRIHDGELVVWDGRDEEWVSPADFFGTEPMEFAGPLEPPE